MRKATLLTSLAIHVGVIALLLFIASIPTVRDTIKSFPNHIPLVVPRTARHDGGGGQRSPLPASRGQAPPRAVAKIFVPPMAVRLEAPKLMVQQAMLEAPEINIAAAETGDPMGKLGPLSGGPGGPNGIGTGLGSTIGAGSKPGQGGLDGPISYKTLGITQEPKVLHSEQPEYSDEARRARYQGTLVLAIEVDPSGIVKNVRVIRGLGLGLDERGIAAVLKWKFRPAMANGRPVTAPALISMTFHLL